MLTDTTRPPLYSPSLRKWLHHLRDPEPHHTLHPITPPTALLPPTYRPTRSARPRHKCTKTEWWYRCLAQDAPETGAAVGHIDALLEESQVVTAWGELLDPAVGALLAFGSAQDEATSGRYVDTLVYAMGPVGADVGMGRVVGAGVEAPVRVVEMQSRVRQLCVAGAAGGEGRRSVMAVRTEGCTALFRQRRLQVPVPGGVSRLAAVPLVSVPAGAGRRAHAHVELNPWYERQFGIIDEGGKWRVYDLEGAQARDWRVRSSVKAVDVARGYVGAEGGGGGGWGRLLWGADVNSVIACDRKRAGLFDIRTTPSSRSEIPIPVHQGLEQGLILDLQRGPPTAAAAAAAPTSDLFLLTTSTLSWHDLRNPARPVLSIPHYRHQNDISLAMALLSIDPAACTTNVLLYSRINSLITSFLFAPNPAESFPVALGHPVSVPGLVPRTADAPVQLTLAVLPTPARQRGAAPPGDDDARFFTAYSVGADLSITQRTYSTGAQPPTPPAPPPRAIKSAYAIGSSSSSSDEAPTAPAQAETRVNFRRLYAHAFPPSDPSLRTDAAHSAATYAARLRAALDNRLRRADLGVVSLRDLAAPATLFDNLDALTAAVNALLATAALAPYRRRPLLPDAPSAEGVYEAVLAAWVAPLPAQVPPRARLQRERIARRIAADVFLAAVGVNLLPKPEAEAEAEPEQKEKEREHVLAIRTYANVSARVTLPEGMAGVLARWEVGADPRDLEYVPDDGGGGAGGVRRRRRRKVERWAPAVAGSSQPVPAVVLSQGPVAPAPAPPVRGRKKRRTGF